MIDRLFEFLQEAEDKPNERFQILQVAVDWLKSTFLESTKYKKKILIYIIKWLIKNEKFPRRIVRYARRSLIKFDELALYRDFIAELTPDISPRDIDISWRLRLRI